MAKIIIKETDIAKEVVRYLQDLHWEVYQEVQVRFGDPIADIVAVQNKVVWAIEVKKTLGWAVLHQAVRWQGFANYISVATPERRYPRGINVITRTFKMWGIGLFHVDKHIEGEYPLIKEVVPPRLDRNAHRDDLLNGLKEQQKTWAMAGNAEGKRWSGFQQTCHDIRRFVLQYPGSTVKQVIENVATHYRSPGTARSCIYQWGKKGLLKGILLIKVKGKYRLFPEKADV